MSDEFPSAFSDFGFGSRIAGYRLEEQIGQGGMAVVYRAYDPRLDRRVALKILAPGLAQDEAFQRRFIRESRAAAAVDHPNIIPVFEAGESGGVLFIAMRFVHGGDVRRLLDAAGPLPPARVADIVSQVASALDAAHARGLVHRDVKPGNMLLDQAAGSGHQDHVYLSDFGLSKQALAETALTSQGQFLGTLDYIAPEQVEGHGVDGRADLYALACAAFELLSGAPPFRRGEGLAVVWAKLSEPPPPLTERRPDLPATVDPVMSRALAKTPADRFAGCGEFAVALRDGLGLRPSDAGARPRPPVPRAATEIAMPAAGLSGPPAAGPPAGGRPAPAETAADTSAAPAASPASPATSVADMPAASAAPAGSPAPPATSVADMPAASAAPAGSPAPPATSIGDVAAASAAPAASPAAPAASAAGPAAPAAPPILAGPPSSAGPSSVPPAPSGPSGAAAPPAPSASAGPPTEAARIPRPQPTRPGLTEPTPPVPPWPGSPGGPPPGTADYRISSGSGSGDYRSPADSRASGDYRSSYGRPSPRDYRETSGASSWPRGPGGAGTVIAPPAPRPSWWRSPAFMATGAVVVVIGVAAAAFAALHHGGSGGGGGTAGGLAAPVTPPACTSTAASPTSISGVHSDTVALGGNPFGVAVTPDGKYSFVARGSSIVVLKDAGGSAAPTQIASVPAPGAAKTEAITSDGKYLLAVTGSGAYVIDAVKAEDGAGSGAVLGTLAGPAGNTSNEVMVSSDNKFAFITFQNNGDVAVFNLQQAIAGGFGHSGYKGLLQLGAQSYPQAMAESPDGSWLYVTGETQNGRLYVVDMNKAETDPQHAGNMSAAAGCGPARVVVSADGSNVWVTDRDSNALVAFSASELIKDPKRALIAKLDVGQTPLGLSFVNGGSEILVADANLHQVAGADNLALISTQMALQGKPGALRGFIPTGRVPRELAAEPGGRTLLSTDYGSGQMQAIEVGSLP